MTVDTRSRRATRQLRHRAGTRHWGIHREAETTTGQKDGRQENQDSRADSHSHRQSRRWMARGAQGGHQLSGPRSRCRRRRGLPRREGTARGPRQPIDEVIEKARSQQATRVAALEAELDAARRALADLDW